MKIVMVRGAVVNRRRQTADTVLEVDEQTGDQLLRSGKAEALPNEADLIPAQPAPVEEWLPDRLTSIWGIGPRRASALRSLGITTYQALADADPLALAEALDGTTVEQVRKWQADAIGFLA